MPTKSDIIQRLEREILPLQGFKPPKGGGVADFGLGPIHAAFPNGHFPTGVVHEFLSSTVEGAAATAGFMGGLLGTLMRGGGAMLWIGAGGMFRGAGVSNGGGMSTSGGRRVFPMALKRFGIEPDRVLFVELSRPKDMLWVMEEGLKCEGLAAVVGEIPEIGFTASRRLQLAVEQSRVTGFLLRHQSRSLGVNACVARWQVNSLPSETEAGLPGVGFPRWNVELLKIRNGRPGVWPVEWAGGRFRALEESAGSRLPMVGAVGTGLPMVGAVGTGLPMVGSVGTGLPMVGSAAAVTALAGQKRKTG